jgi:O-antigen ligase
MRWWETIVQYTVHGKYFWAGKGLGINLAADDGFVVGDRPKGPPLRSPHNVHLTILARGGVPGLVLWLLLLVSWFVTLALHARAAYRQGEIFWARLFLWLICYVAAVLVDASFDVALEGPMLGIWFWTLFGLGLGTSMVYRSRYPSRSASRGIDHLRLS